MFFDSTLYILWFTAFVVFVNLLCYAVHVHDELPDYPVKILAIDVTGRRNVDSWDLLDAYLIDEGVEEIRAHEAVLQKWQDTCNEIIKRAFFKGSCRKRYLLMAKNPPVVVRGIRQRTRYRQVNYVRYPYTVDEVSLEMPLSFLDVYSRYDALYEIGFETTLRNYASKNQRRLMTKELREKIKVRDNYTCQMCGKYMPDNVGLHIDHIVPIAKGGKTVESNLQVLCSVCNGRKSSKV